MGFVKAACTNCGGILDVDASKDAWVCRYCNTPFITEKAINNYNSNNYINAEKVEVYGSKAPFEELLRKESVFRRLGEREKLKKLYDTMMNDYSDRYETWWGMLTFYTEDFSLMPKGSGDKSIEKFDQWFELCRECVPDSRTFAPLKRQYDEYKRKHLTKLLELSEQQSEFLKREYNRDIENYNRNIENCNSNIREAKKKTSGIWFGLFAFIAFELWLFIGKSTSSQALAIVLAFFIIPAILIPLVEATKNSRSRKKTSAINVENINKGIAELTSNYEKNMREINEHIANIREQLSRL